MYPLVITKKIAKHGNQNIIILPSILKEELPCSSLVKVSIELLKKPENREEEQ